MTKFAIGCILVFLLLAFSSTYANLMEIIGRERHQSQAVLAPFNFEQSTDLPHVGTTPKYHNIVVEENGISLQKHPQFEHQLQKIISIKIYRSDEPSPNADKVEQEAMYNEPQMQQQMPDPERHHPSCLIFEISDLLNEKISEENSNAIVHLLRHSLHECPGFRATLQLLQKVMEIKGMDFERTVQLIDNLQNQESASTHLTISSKSLTSMFSNPSSTTTVEINVFRPENDYEGMEEMMSQ